MENKEENENKEVEIISGDGDLDISPVYTHLNIGKKPADDANKKNIVIPEEKK